MATTVQDNPFDTQQPAATNTGVTTQQPTAGQMPGNVGTTTPATPNVATYAPTTRQVNQQTDTVQGQVNSILSTDSPLMQRARTLATQQMAQRGLVNSSMAQGAGVAAMTDRALPMAQQDANTYSQVSQDNMNAFNQSGQFNAGEINRFALQRNEQDFQAGQAEINRGFQTSERVGGQDFQAAQADLGRQYQTSERVGGQDFQAGQNQIQMDFNRQMQILQESGLDFRQARDIASREAITQLEQAGIMNRFDQELALKSDMFNVEQINADRRMIEQNNFEMQKLGIQLNAQRADIPTQFAANISNTTMQGVNAIMADGNMTPAAKQGAIDNLVKYANSQISWASAFYGTAMPPINRPAFA